MDKLKSIRNSNGGVRGSVKSLVGRGDDGFAQARGRAEAHNSTPLSALKDPASFAPPPKHSGARSDSEGIAERRQSPIASPTSSASPARPLPSRPTNGRAIADQQAAEAKTSSSGPFRLDTTGLSTAHLPKPPVKRTGSLDIAMQEQTLNTTPASTAKPKKPGPPLPPRLPPRSAVASAIPLSPPPAYSSPITSSFSAAQEPQDTGNLLNQDAIRRLGSAGVSVPGFDIVPSRSVTDRAHVSHTASTHSETQTRLANLASAASVNAGKAGNLGVLPERQSVIIPAKPALPSFARNAQVPSTNERPGPPPVPLNTKPR